MRTKPPIAQVSANQCDPAPCANYPELSMNSQPNTNLTMTTIILTHLRQLGRLLAVGTVRSPSSTKIRLELPPLAPPTPGTSNRSTHPPARVLSWRTGGMLVSPATPARRRARTIPLAGWVALAVLVLGAGKLLAAEISLTGTTSTENFTIGTSATASLPDGWVISVPCTTSATCGDAAPTYSKAGNVTATTVASSSGSPATGGRYNWGDGATTTDRAVGFMTSGTYGSPNSIMVGYVNNTGSTITGVTLGFDYERYRINSAAAAITFFYSTDGSTWTAVTAGDSGAYSTGSSSYAYPIDTISKPSVSITGLSIANTTGKIYFRWNFNTTGANSQGLGLDNFSMTATLAATGDMIMSAIASSESATISSLLNDTTITTTSQGVQVWQVALHNPAGGLGDGTVSAITFSKGASDGVSNWSAAIQVAELFDGNTALASGTVSASTIAFSGLSVLVTDGGSKTLSLRISLKSTAGALTDNAKFQFALTSSNVTVTGNGVTTASISSDSTKNQITVEATKLAFSSVPSSVTVGTSFSATAQAQDANGNIDLDRTDSVTVSKVTGTGTLSGGTAQSLVTGAREFASLTYDTVEGFTIQATASGLTAATSGNITAMTANATANLFTANASGSAWLNTGNWSLSVVPTGSQVAQFGVNPTGAGLVKINLDFSGNNQPIGAIEVTSARTLALYIGDSSATAGTLTLNGVVVNNVANVVLRNNSSHDVTLQAAQSGTMGVALGNTTDNKVSLDGSGSIVISSIISGSSKALSLAGSGSGSLTLTGVNTYSGNTTISAGTLLVNSPGSLAASSAVTVASGGKLGGTGTVNGTVTVNGTIAAGASVGQLNTGAETWAPGGTNVWEISTATNTASAGTPGQDWDFLSITGDLTITATNKTDAEKFTIKVVNAGTLSNPTNFDAAKYYSWKMAEVTGSVVGFNAAKFLVVSNNFSPAPAGTFSVAQMDKALYVVYAPTAAPCAYFTTNWLGLEILSDPLRTNMLMTFTNNSGLASVQALRMDNCTISGTAYTANDSSSEAAGPLSLTSRTPLPANTVKVVLTAVKGTPTLLATVNVITIDTCGRGKSFDPVLTTLGIASGNQVEQRFDGLLSAERYLQVFNGTPGLRWLEVNMNGRIFRLDPLTNSQEVAADLGSAMLEGEHNVVILTGGGDAGASAMVLITDTPGANQIVLPELVKLSVTRTAAGLELSWPETLSGWQLEVSAAASSGWTDVSITPATVDGQQAVTVPTGDGAQFYRLRGPAPAASSSPVPAVSAREAGTGIALQPAASSLQPSVRRVLGGVLW